MTDLDPWFVSPELRGWHRLRALDELALHAARHNDRAEHFRLTVESWRLAARMLRENPGDPSLRYCRTLFRAVIDDYLEGRRPAGLLAPQ